jgi:hypothetical protein
MVDGCKFNAISMLLRLLFRNYVLSNNKGNLIYSIAYPLIFLAASNTDPFT